MQYRNETHTQSLLAKMIYIKEQFDINKSDSPKALQRYACKGHNHNKEI
jgi:hypothetical protein